ncbi:MAG: hypothetical protein ACFFDS_09250 [Candidatus Thorarchaeota archaeon]
MTFSTIEMSKTILLEGDLICPECGENTFATTRSDIVCKNCASVVERVIEGSHFLSRGESERMGSPESRRGGKSTFFKIHDANAGEKRERYKRLWNVENSIYHAVDEQKSRLLSILTKIGLSENERNSVMFELKKVYNQERFNKRKVTNIFLLAAAITIKQLKNKGRATSINDIVGIFKAHGCKLSSKSIRDYILDHNMSYKTSSAKQFVPVYLAKLKSNDVLRDRLNQINPKDELVVDKMFTTIERIATKLSEIKQSGRKPSVFSVSCLYVATCMVGQRYTGSNLLTKEEISRFCNIPSTSLRDHTRFLMNNVKLNL